jgi:hypothetical protein
MKTYDVTIKETLTKVVLVTAESAEAAQRKVEREWKDEIHVLSADDYTGVMFSTAPHRCDLAWER